MPPACSTGRRSPELIPYRVDEENLAAAHVAEELGEPVGQVFKTLVLRGDRNGILVCVIPGDAEVDLKAAAQASGNKRVEMLHMKELLPVTGYIRGGCSPVRDEKRVSDVYSSQLPRLRYDLCQRRGAGIAVEAGSRRSDSFYAGRDGRPDRMTDGFADILIRWYADNHRRLPWRETSDPYLIWLSEVILQQTRVAQGLDYFRRFVARFPDVRSLAEAPQDEVLKLWQGLGYYSRARSLHTAAKDIMARFGGRFREDYEAVRSLCGVGIIPLPRSVRSLSCLMRRSTAMFIGCFPACTTIVAGGRCGGQTLLRRIGAVVARSGTSGLQNQATMEFGSAMRAAASRLRGVSAGRPLSGAGARHGWPASGETRQSGRAAALLQLLVHPLRRDIVVAAAYREGYLAQPVRISADRDRCGRPSSTRCSGLPHGKRGSAANGGCGSGNGRRCRGTYCRTGLFTLAFRRSNWSGFRIRCPAF